MFLPVFPEKIAEHLGITELKVGARRIDSEGGPPVLAWWMLSVNPCFARNWAVGAIHEEIYRDGPHSDGIVIHGFVADSEEAAIKTLEEDKGLIAIHKLNPFRVAPARRMPLGFVDDPKKQSWCEVRTLDGLSYCLRWGNKASEGQFRMSNPHVAWAKIFEKRVGAFAKEVLSDTSQFRLEGHLNLCRKTRRDSKK